jgi:hypothetical protein
MPPHSTGQDDSVFSRIVRFGEMFDWRVAKIAACMARFCLLPHTDTASGRQGSDKPIARKKQINIVGQSDKEPEQ